MASTVSADDLSVWFENMGIEHTGKNEEVYRIIFRHVSEALPDSVDDATTFLFGVYVENGARDFTRVVNGLINFCGFAKKFPTERDISHDLVTPIAEELIRMETAEPKKLNRILDLLRNEHDARLKSFRVSNAMDERTYFIEGIDAALFRHEGEPEASPKFVYLAKDSDGRIFVYFTASGSGKSVELAGNAFVRGKDLAIYLKPSSDIEWEESGDKDQRHNAAINFMKELIEGVRKNNLNLLAAIAEEYPSSGSVVVAIDEASSCPQFIRAILAKPLDFKNMVLAEFDELNLNSIVFSVGGTGASRGSIGSEQKNWCLKTTSAKQSPGQVYNILCNQKSNTMPSIEVLKEVAPVLRTLVIHNARMASIVIRIMEMIVFNRPNVNIKALSHQESYIASLVMNRFVGSNGLEDLANDPKLSCIVGAQALAVHLFDEGAQIPNNQVEREIFASTMEYGIGARFATFTEPMITLVSTYGMVTPLDMPRETSGGENRKMMKSFLVDEAMQLVALHLLQLPVNCSPLDPGFAGFEITCTQIVKGALAASSTLAIDQPSVYDVLTKTGFGFGPKVSDKFTPTDEQLMERFKTVKVVRHAMSRKDYIDNICPWGTYLQCHPMTLAKTGEAAMYEVDTASRQTQLVLNRNKDETALLADQHMMDFLLCIRGPNPDPTVVESLFFPFATIACGNSEYADGYVTFVGLGSDDCFYLFTIMIQAKDYGPNSPLKFSKIQTNVERCRSHFLAVPFGIFRLMCVASRSSHLNTKPKSIERNFVSYETDKSAILSNLLNALYDNRNKSNEAPVCTYRVMPKKSDRLSS